jgi:hypothetical protein
MTKEKDDKDLAPYLVFEGTAWEAGLLKSILEDNDIETIIEQDMSLPWNIIPTTGAQAKVFVAFKDLEQAKTIVDEFFTNMEKENTGEEPE